MLLIGFSTVTYAEKESSGNIENKQTNVTSITGSDKQKITNDFYALRNWLITNILHAKDIQTIPKTTKSYKIKSIDELKSSLILLATKQLKSGDYISEECSYFSLSVYVESLFRTIKELNNCDRNNCTEDDLKNIVDLLKIEIDYQEKFIPKCHELGIL